jgi:hypothetical protein
MNTFTNNKVAKYTSLFVILALTLVEVYYKQTSIFYVLYLFWFDEFIKTVFERITYTFKKEKIENPIKFLQNVKNKFFMLFVYFIFIVIVFGLVIDRNDFDLIGINLTVLTFQNTFFNFSIVAFILREFYLYINISKSNDDNYSVSNGIIILHISIILGIFSWFLLIKKIHVPLEFIGIISITPFLLLKTFFEINSVD